MTVYKALLEIQSSLLNEQYLLRLGRLFSAQVLVKIEENEYFLTFEKGQITSIDVNPKIKMPWHFAFRTDELALNEFWQKMPKPGFHDIFGLVKIGRAEIDGDIILLIKNLRFFKEVLALARNKDE